MSPCPHPRDRRRRRRRLRRGRWLPVHHEEHEWIAAFGAHYALGVDGIGLTLVLLTAILTPVVILGVVGRRRRWPLGRERVLRLDAGARGPRHRCLRRDRRVLVLRAVRGHADPDLLPDRRLLGSPGAPTPRSSSCSTPSRRPADAGLGDRPVRRLRGQRDRADVPALRAEPDGDGPERRPLAVPGLLHAFAIKAPMFPVHTRLPDAVSEGRPAPRCRWSASWTRSAPSG